MCPEMNRRRFLLTGTAVAGSALAKAAPAVQVLHPFDLLIKGATILDGTGGPPWRADVGLQGDTIAALAEIDPARARAVIEATNLQVAPGFIDMHSHSDRSIVRYPQAESRIMQGITTEVTGNCGGSAAPRRGERDGQTRWTDVASYFDVIEQTRISVNQAFLLGQGTLRSNLVGSVNRRLTKVEMKALIRSVEEGLDQGAIGLSTGLEYTPGRWTPTEEIVAMARVVARRGVLYSSHIRNEEAQLLEAVHEAISIGRQTGCRVEVSHVKAAGQPNWDKQDAALHLIESARRSGVDVLGDAYPYAAYSTGVTIFLPSWAAEGGGDAIAQRLADPELRAQIRQEILPRVASDPGDFSLVVVASVSSEKNRWVVGKNFNEIAESWAMEPVDALLRLMQEERGRVSFIGHGMEEANVEKVLSHPLVMIGSDGSAQAPRGDATRSRPHPRSYGTCARVLQRYVRDRQLFDLPTAIRKMAAMPASHARLRDRGRIAKGLKADLVVFDAARVQEVSSFEDPHRYPLGIRDVIVNGVPVLRDGQHTGARPGRVLRH